MVKSYLRYAEKKIWGVVASRNVNVVYTPDGHSVLTGALHQICVWSVGTGELVCLLFRFFFTFFHLLFSSTRNFGGSEQFLFFFRSYQLEMKQKMDQ